MPYLALQRICARVDDVEVSHHPLFTRWLTDLAETVPTVAAEVQALIDALERHGLDLGDPTAHPIVTSTPQLWALRRTPPAPDIPHATSPPVIRILYGYAQPPGQPARAILLYGGDKTELGNRWYPPAIAEAERRLTILTGQRGWRIIKTHRAS